MGSSQQPIIDAIAGSSDGSIPQIDLTGSGAALDAGSGLNISSYLPGTSSSTPWSTYALYAFLAVAAIVALRKL